ncbi:hypothetical protein CAFE_34150 [Caprobacter fermentans]|uniref:DUF1385 domain-containing protein n=2 Tax=Caproicibacter fermentans TaxID=2576756 RepID=A0A6N8I585_9FIRM|nr:DUF1385 domain-containing protein [Caproicibacter fermentans]MVB12673.1 hypothetical protein [Caproicibacter fermentans]OCM99929.1 metal-dependent enzyme [Clostridium sp. W14A]
MPREKIKCITSIGGQALIEGIMMRGPKKTVLAVRQPDGEITLEELPAKDPRTRHPLLKLPFLRGVAAFVDSIAVGYRALSRSAEISGMEEVEEGEESKFDKWLNDKFGDQITNIVMTIGTVFGILLAIALFYILPTWLFNLIPGAAGPDFAVWRSPVEGLMRMVILLAYMTAISQMKDIRRLFQYHGAEHKTIFCYESGEELTVENVRRHRRFHPRCGTSFLVLMLLVGIFIGLFIPFSNPLLRTAVKILCIPLVMGIGYELIRYCGRNENMLTRIIAAPGLWVQRITTKEPDDSMMEAAIAAMKEVIPENGEDKIALKSDS